MALTAHGVACGHPGCESPATIQRAHTQKIRLYGDETREGTPLLCVRLRWARVDVARPATCQQAVRDYSKSGPILFPCLFRSGVFQEIDIDNDISKGVKYTLARRESVRGLIHEMLLTLCCDELLSHS